VDACNADVADGNDAFGKRDPMPLEGTLFGFRYGVGAHYFMDGLLIDENTWVLDEAEQPVPNLCAAGTVPRRGRSPDSGTASPGPPQPARRPPLAPHSRDKLVI